MQNASTTPRLNLYVPMVIAGGLILCGACALFPPRHDLRTVSGIPRVFLFSPGINLVPASPHDTDYPVEIDAGRLLAECILVIVVCGLMVLALQLNGVNAKGASTEPT